MQIAVAIGLALATAVTVIWLRDRPLRDAETALREGKPERAQRLLADFLDEHPDDSRGLALQARTWLALGQPQRTIRLFSQLGVANAEEAHAWAQAYMHLEQWTLALPLLIRVVELEPDNADALYELTICRVRLGDQAKAKEIAQRLTRVKGSEARGYVFLAAIANDRANPREAADDFAQALKYSPQAKNLQVSAAEFFAEYGRTLQAIGEPLQTQKQLSRSIEVAPTAAALSSLGEVELELGDAKKAEAAWKQTLELEPGNREAREGLANLALSHADPKAARHWLEPLISSSDMKASTAYLLQRISTLENDEAGTAKWRKTTEELRKRQRLQTAIDSTLHEAPDSHWATVIRAYRFAEAGNWAQAELSIGELGPDEKPDPFTADLATAIKNHSTLPPLDRLPILQY